MTASDTTPNQEPATPFNLFHLQTLITMTTAKKTASKKPAAKKAAPTKKAATPAVKKAVSKVGDPQAVAPVKVAAKKAAAPAAKKPAIRQHKVGDFGDYTIKGEKVRGKVANVEQRANGTWIKVVAGKNSSIPGKEHTIRAQAFTRSK